MARLVFFRYTPEGYVGDDENGLLVGTGWSDTFGNGFRAIIFLPDLSELKWQRSVQFIYDVEVLPEGQPKYIHSATRTLVLSNDVMVEYDPEAAVLMQLFSRNATRADPLSTTSIGQLDLFIGLYFKGTIVPPVAGLPPIYEWLTDLIIAVENPPAVLSEETLAIIALLESMGIHLTDAQKLELDNLVRGLPAPAPPAEGSGTSSKLPADVITLIQGWGYTIS